MKENNLSLQGDPSFLEILGQGESYYGGSQTWFKDKSKIRNGCGPVALANVFGYLAKRGKKYESLYDKKDYTKDSFTDFQLSIYKTLDPKPYGMISKRDFIRRALNYGRLKGVDLSYEKLFSRDKNFTPYSTYSFIRYALSRDLPVCAINLYPGRSFKFYWHWLVITGSHIRDGEVILLVSSWGKKHSIKLLDLYGAMQYGGGLIYFY